MSKSFIEQWAQKPVTEIDWLKVATQIPRAVAAATRPAVRGSFPVHEFELTPEERIQHKDFVQFEASLPDDSVLWARLFEAKVHFHGRVRYNHNIPLKARVELLSETGYWWEEEAVV
ncbi:MAG: hypothetical protein PHE17_17985 [Thiothrix sp.]|uniref:hypothetical protein n=1 Tax=Thiothrix sp. TaxID=1032 RepID=UPI00260C710B|nr:hypothetical protein [Thiothrix sp.]MDD5394911.1 hypothetical protein [Thiothrix sp.]